MVYGYRSGLRTRRYRKKRYVFANDNLAVYRNPFSPRSMTARIPDGKAYDSTGVRLQQVIECQTGATGELWVCIFPGINNTLWVVDAGNADPQNALDGLWMAPFSQHAIIKLEQGSNSKLEQQENGQIAKWRLVSQGCKISLINNSDENDGWWESIRVQVAANQLNEFAWKKFPSSVTNDQWYVGPSESWSGLAGPGNETDNIKTPGMVFKNLALSEHPTYTTGKLRDIHRHSFVLHPTGKDHDFIEMDAKWDAVLDPANETVDSVKQGFDTNFDAIFIRIWGRKATSGVNPTRLLFHTVANQEIIYDEGAILSRYHQKTDKAVDPSRMEAERRRLNSNKMAATKQRAIVKFQGY